MPIHLTEDNWDQYVTDTGGALIDDGTTALDTTWSSTKINSELAGRRPTGVNIPWNEVGKAGSTLDSIEDVPARVANAVVGTNSGNSIIWIPISTLGGGGSTTLGIQDLGTLTVATNVDFASGEIAKAVLGAPAVEFSFANLASDEGRFVTLRVEQDATAGRNATFTGANIVAPGDVWPKNTGVAARADLYVFLWDGTRFSLFGFASNV